MLQKGQVLNNRYQIQTILGEGGFGAVYKVWDDNLQRHCALKENLQISLEAQKQFKREAIMLANLNYPHLVRVTDYFIIQNQGQYLVMDFVEGYDLGTLLKQNGGPFPIEQALTWINQVCDALIYIHNQNPPIIHRDIKPSNIRITTQGNAVLVDFGLAKVFEDTVTTTMGARGLTPHFAAPEQYGTGGTDAQSDIYSLGVTLYCLLTYRVPPDSVEIMVGNVEPPPLAKIINRNISDSVSDALQRAMQIRRTERYKSVSDFKDALGGSQAGQIVNPVYKIPTRVATSTNKLTLSNGMEFMRVPAGKFLMGSDIDDDLYSDESPQHIIDIPYDYWMARFLVTNKQYNIYTQHKGITHPVEDWEKKKDHPIIHVQWVDAMTYCQWLNNLLKDELPSSLVLRLPTEAEWEKAARGTDGREFPWGNNFDKDKCNTRESGKDDTTSVGLYSPHGDSPYDCVDMSGNVWEWMHSLKKVYPYRINDGREDEKVSGARVTRGGSFFFGKNGARCAYRYDDRLPLFGDNIGFRVCLAQPLPK